jgi:hypothetical protein
LRQSQWRGEQGHPCHHARRPFFALADVEASAPRKAEGKAPVPISPLALEIVQRMDQLLEIERGING